MTHPGWPGHERVGDEIEEQTLGDDPRPPIKVSTEQDLTPM